MSDGSKNLRSMLTSCFERCKQHDAFRASAFQYIKEAIENDEVDPRAALIELAQLFDSKYVANVNFNPKREEPVVTPQPEPEGPEDRPRGPVHGGEELTTNPNKE